MIPLDRLAAYLKLDLESPDMGVAYDIFDRQLARVEMLTGRHFREPVQSIQRYRGVGDSLWLPEAPIIDEDSDPPKVVLVEQYGSDWEEIEAADYEIVTRMAESRSPGYAELIHGAGWPTSTARRQNLRVTYWHGYEVGSLPGDIEQVVLEMTAARFRDRDRGSEGLRSESIGGYSYTRSDLDPLLDDWKDTLSTWRRLVFA